MRSKEEFRDKKGELALPSRFACNVSYKAAQTALTSV